MRAHNPQSIHRYFRMKISDTVLPPLSGLWVGEVGESCWAGPDLDTQDGNVQDAHTQG